MHKTVAILIFPGVQSLDVTGPMDVFCEANRFLAPADHYQLEVIGQVQGTLPAPTVCHCRPISITAMRYKPMTCCW